MSDVPVTPDAPDALAGREKHREMPTGVVMVGMAVVVWWPAFTLGAWGEIFFDELLALWAASTAAFVFVLVERRPVGARLVRAFLLLLPSVLIVLMFVVSDTSDLAAALVDLTAVAAVLLGLPFTLWVLVRIVWPDFATETRRRTKVLIMTVVVGVAVGSFVLGANQAGFLTCEDFAISGNSEPEGCVHETPDAASGSSLGES